MKRYNPNIYIGLTKEEVKSRKKDKLVNYNTDLPTKSIGQIIYYNVFTLFNMLNLFIAFIILLVHSYKNLLFMGVVICNTLISIIQEIRSKRVIDKLSVISMQKVSVVRDGKEIEIAIDEIVLDDIIKYKNGNQVVVDSIIKEGSVEVDESFITGESNTILKQKGDMLLSGSFIVSGNCISKVEHIGEDNYTSKISKEAKYIKKTNSVIMNTLKVIIKWISFIIIPLGILLFVRQYNLDEGNLVNTVINTSAAIIAMIPEGLVLLTSTVFAVSAIRLSNKKVLVQDLYCIETLARVDTLCLDKTGTITEGNLELVKVINFDKSDTDKILSEISNILKTDNKTMQAINDKYNLKSTFKPINIVPFSSIRKYSGVGFKDEGSFIIGSPDKLIKSHKANKYLKEYKEYRVLALMHSKQLFNDYELPSKMKLVALIVLEDKIRKSADATLKYLSSEKIDLKIISGDSSLTVGSIAKRVGINPKIIDMSTVKETDNLKEIVEKYNIFTRVLPDQKKELICSLKLNGHTVAFTGDGVNDVLALKESDLSIAMSSGSDAARNVSQMVLLNSDFQSVPKILNEGRRSINNIERSSTLFLTKTIYATILTIIFLFISRQYPFQLIQLSLTSAITIGIPSFLLALENNKKRVTGNYIINVLSKSIPAALTIVIDVLSVLFVSLIYHLTDKEISTMSVLLVAFTGFLLLYRLCIPFNRNRLILFIGLLLLFLTIVIGLSSFFELVILSFPKFIFIGIIFMLDICLFNFMSEICEKKIFKKKEKIIRRMS